MFRDRVVCLDAVNGERLSKPEEKKKKIAGTQNAKDGNRWQMEIVSPAQLVEYCIALRLREVVKGRAI